MKMWSPEPRRFRLRYRDGVMLFIGIYIGAMGTVTLAYFWERLL